MAFNPSAQGSTTVVQNTDWKAQGFINIYLPKAGGEGKTKLGAIPLKLSNKFEATLIERLSSDPEALAKMLALVTMDFRLADDPKAPAPVLPF